MKILYAIQGTGNGHITRALQIVPALKKKANVEVLISGYQAELSLPFEVNYKFRGLSFVFGNNGGINYLDTYKKSNVRQFYNEVKTLDTSKYDIVISDFEPISAWACHNKKQVCVGLSNQATLLSKGVPKPKTDDILGKMVLKNYAPCPVVYGYHYEKYNESIYNPIIRNEIRFGQKDERDHYLVYLPAYKDETIYQTLSQLKNIKWKVFTKKSFVESRIGNVEFIPINNEKFTEALLTCKGVVCAAGFATTTEALFLGKKLLVVPQKRQIEQDYNKVALKKLGVHSIKNIKPKSAELIEHWINTAVPVHIDYADETEQLLNTIINNNSLQNDNYINYISSEQFNTSFPAISYN